MSYDKDKLLQEAQERAYKNLEDLQNVPVIPSAEQLSSITDERLKEKPLERSAPSTGYKELDMLVKGFIPGHLYTLTGETNVGKTSIASNFAVRMATQKRRVLYFALEPGNNIVDYLASVFHTKPFDSLSDEDYNLPLESIEIYTKEQVPDTETLIHIVEALDRYDLIIIDHIGYFITSESNPIQQQSNVVKKLALLAKRKSCAMMLIAHLRKRGQQRKSMMPTADDISGSAAFKQDSTEIFIVTRMPKSDNQDEVELSPYGKFFVLKTKAGRNGVMDITFSERSALIYSDGDIFQ